MKYAKTQINYGNLSPCRYRHGSRGLAHGRQYFQDRIYTREGKRFLMVNAIREKHNTFVSRFVVQYPYNFTALEPFLRRGYE